MKPTFGFVPYTGAIGQGHSYDHLGPITSSVEDAALALDILSGEDSYDARQTSSADKPDSVGALGSLKKLKIGVLEDGFIRAGIGTDVCSVVDNALKDWRGPGVTLDSIEIPFHTYGSEIWRGVAIGEAAAYLREFGVCSYINGFQDPKFFQFLGKRMQESPNLIPRAVKQRIILAAYTATKYHRRYEAVAGNLLPELSRQYDQVLNEYDVLAMPTVLTIPETRDGYTPDEPFDRGTSIIANTAPFNMTGHPAISLPAGTLSSGIPVGLMLVGGRWEDDSVLDAAKHFQDAVSVNCSPH